MKKLRLVILVIIILSFSNAGFNKSDLFSQTVNFGAKAGFSIPQLRDRGSNEISRGYESRFAPAFGVFLNNYFTTNFALQIEALFVGQGGERSKMQPIPAENLEEFQVPLNMKLYADFDNVAILNYLEIPILAKYRIQLADLVNVYADFGPYLGILLSAKTKTSGTSRIYLDKDGSIPLTDGQGHPLPPVNFENERTITNDIEGANFGLMAEIGVGIKMGKSELSLDIRGSNGFSHIQKDTKKNGKNSTGALVVTAGYSIEL